MNFRVKSIILLLVTTILLGCQSARKTLDLKTTVELQIKALNNINPNEQKRPSPLIIQLHYLADNVQFEREDFLSLYEKASERLGKDLIDKQSLKEFSPGESRIEKMVINNNAKYIGILAEFFDYDVANPLLILPITEHRKNSYRIVIDRTDIKVIESY